MNLLLSKQFTPSLSVYRNAEFRSDSTRNGVSARFASLRVIYVYDEYLGASRQSVLDSLAATPGVQENDCILVRRAPCSGRRADTVVPVSAFVSGKWFMNGGNYADSCDSRWSEMKGVYGATPIHDRIET